MPEVLPKGPCVPSSLSVVVGTVALSHRIPRVAEQPSSESCGAGMEGEAVTTELEGFTPDEVMPAPAPLDVGRIDRALADARSASTRRNYDRQWSRFVDHCLRRDLPWCPAPPDVVCDYLLSMENTLTLSPDDDTVGHTYSWRVPNERFHGHP